MNNRKIYTYLSQSDIALQIELLVQAIEKTDTSAFRIKPSRSGCERVEATRLSRYFTHIKQMVDLFDDRMEYSYSEHLQAFREACQDVGLERGIDGPICLNERGTAYLDHHHSMNALVARIRELTPTCSSDEIKLIWASLDRNRAVTLDFPRVSGGFADELGLFWTIKKPACGRLLGGGFGLFLVSRNRL